MGSSPDPVSSLASDTELVLPGSLLTLTNEMVRNVFRFGHTETLKRACELVRSAPLIHSEACAIFVIDPESPHELILRAQNCDVSGADFETVRVSLRNAEGGGLTAHIVRGRLPVRLHGSELKHHPHVSGQHTPYLAGPHNSLLAVPVLDQRGRVVALVKFSNKKDADGISGPATFFTDADEAAARIFCNILALVFESSNVLRSYRKILDMIASDCGLEAVLGCVLNAGRTVLGADRGDVVVWDENRGQLILAAGMGETTLKLHEVVPPGGLVGHAWTKQELQRCDDTTACTDYVEFWRQTRSEIAYPINRFGKRFGVINFESSQPGNFGARDKRVLLDLTSFAGVAINSISSRPSVEGVAKFLADPGGGDEYALDKLLENWIADASLCGILYLANDAERVLESKAVLRVPATAEIDPKKIRYPYDGISFASKVRRERKTCFSPDPYNDPDVQQTIARKCGIPGPLLGIPLMAEEDVVGALVVWRQVAEGQKYWQTRAEYAEVEQNLLAMAGLWASLLQWLEATRRKRAVLDEICRIGTWGAGDLESRLHRIGIALQADGFDRVRLFRWDAEKLQFRGWLSWGMSDPERFLTVAVAPTNPYTEYTVKRSLVDPTARLFDPGRQGRGKGPVVNLGLDPDAAVIEKGPETPWAVVPLVFNGKLYGQIAADTARSSRRISAESLEYMTVIGALAAQIIASDEMIERETKIRVEKLGDEVLEVILHTIKTPVHSVVGIVDRLIQLDPAGDPDQIRLWLDRLQDQVEWLEDLMCETDSFVDCMSRYRVRDESLAEVARAAVSLVEPLAAEKKVQIVLHSPEADPCPFAGDRDVVRIIMQNLLDNAVKHSPRGSRVEMRLTAEPEEKLYRIGVADEGPGIRNEEVEALMGHDVGLPRITNPEGHGLGLAIAQALAARAGGELRYLQRPGARGAAFMLTLPQRSRR